MLRDLRSVGAIAAQNHLRIAAGNKLAAMLCCELIAQGAVVVDHSVRDERCAVQRVDERLRPTVGVDDR